MTIIYVIAAFFVGCIVTAVLFNNRHHRDVAELFDEIDRHIDRASDMPSATWRKIRRQLK